MKLHFIGKSRYSCSEFTVNPGQVVQDIVSKVKIAQLRRDFPQDWVLVEDDFVPHNEGQNSLGLGFELQSAPLIPGEAIAEVFSEPLSAPELNGIVSIIIPTFNSAVCLAKAIRSALTQTYRYKEVIVVDDGSTDNTSSVVSKFSEVVYLYQRNLGCAGAFNRGIKASKGEYLSWLSADDYYIDLEATTKRVRILEKDKSLSFVYSDFDDKIGEVVRQAVAPYYKTSEEAYERNKNECVINGSTLLWRRSCIYNIGLFNTAYRYCQDWDYWFRLFKNYRGWKIPESLIMRTNGNNPLGQEVQTSNAARELLLQEKESVYKVLRLNEVPRPKVCVELSVRNESSMIENCLDDLTQWVDCIAILNDGSTDDTKTRIKKYPKVTAYGEIPFRGNVRTEGKDRQQLLSLAQSTNPDFILFVDCDEVFEHCMKWKLLDMLLREDISLWSFLEVNFWRGFTNYRTDEMFYRGWFDRLFRNSKDLVIEQRWDEHCGAVPTNIPNAPLWQEGGASKRSDVRVKHYGYAYWDRVINRYCDRMERDPYKKELNRGGWLFYERMIDETDLVLAPFEGETVASYMKRGLC